MNSAQTLTNLINNWKASGVTKAELIVMAGEAMIGWPYAWGATGQKCTVANREARIKNPRISEGDIRLIRERCQVMKGTAKGCDGCKYYPAGVTQIHDCIGFVNKLLDIAGVPHYGAGCSTMWNHQANWISKGIVADIPERVCCVFQQVRGQENKMDHIGIYVGAGFVVHCSKEVKFQKLGEYPWTHFAVPAGIEGDTPMRPTIRKGSRGDDVKYAQEQLLKKGYDVGRSGADGIFGNGTLEAVKSFQRDNGLNADGVVGPRTWEKLQEDPQPEPGTKLFTVTIHHLTEFQADALLERYPGSEKRAEGSEQ